MAFLPYHPLTHYYYIIKHTDGNNHVSYTINYKWLGYMFPIEILACPNTPYMAFNSADMAIDYITKYIPTQTNTAYVMPLYEIDKDNLIITKQTKQYQCIRFKGYQMKYKVCLTGTLKECTQLANIINKKMKINVEK